MRHSKGKALWPWLISLLICVAVGIRKLCQRTGWPWPKVEVILPVTNRQTSVPKDLQPVALASLADNIQRYPYAKVFSVEWGSYSHFYDCDDHVLRYVYDRDQGTFMYDDIVSAERKCCAEHQVYEGVADSAVLQVAHKRGTHLQLSHYGGKLNPRLSQALHSCCMSRAVINSELQRHNQVMQRLRSGSP